MGKFSPAEVEFLLGHKMGRIATIGRDGDPHLVPLRYRFNPELEVIEIGGHGDPSRKRYHQNLLRTGRAAFLVDDLVAPGKPRAVEVRGAIEIVPEGGQLIVPDFEPAMVRLWPSHILSWGILDDNPFNRWGRDV